MSKIVFLIRTFRYEDVCNFSEGLARVRWKGKDFHILPNGKPAYNERYDWVGKFLRGFAWVDLEGKGFHILPNGKPAYIERYSQVSSFSVQMLAIAKLDGLAFHILPNGKPAYNEMYDGVGHFKDGFAWVLKGNDKFRIKPDGSRLK
jgi:hypothetical protein